MLDDAWVYRISFDSWKEVANRKFCVRCGYGLDLRYTVFSTTVRTVRAQPHRRKQLLTDNRTAPHRTILENSNPHRTAPYDFEKLKTAPHRTAPYDSQKLKLHRTAAYDFENRKKRTVVRFYTVKSPVFFSRKKLIWLGEEAGFALEIGLELPW